MTFHSQTDSVSLRARRLKPVWQPIPGVPTSVTSGFCGLAWLRWSFGVMNRLLMVLVLLSLPAPAGMAGSQTDIYSTNFWEIKGRAGDETWVEIHNSSEAKTNGIAHVSVIKRKKGSPAWKIEWVCPHIAITTDALRRSVTRPYKTRAVYPEQFFEAYDRWKEDKKKGAAVVCSTSVQDFLKKRQ